MKFLCLYWPANVPLDLGTARFGAGVDAVLRKADYCPSFGRRREIKQGIASLRAWLPMPVRAVRLNDQPRIFKHEVRLPSSEHRTVHFKVQSSPRKLRVQGRFDARHFRGEVLPESRLANLLPHLRTESASGAGRVELPLPIWCPQQWRSRKPRRNLHPVFGLAPRTLYAARRAAIVPLVAGHSLEWGTANWAGYTLPPLAPSSGQITLPGAIARPLGIVPRSLWCKAVAAVEAWHLSARVTFSLTRVLCGKRRAAFQASLRSVVHVDIIPHFELNSGYWADAVAYCEAEEAKLATGDLFSLLEVEAAESADELPEEVLA